MAPQNVNVSIVVPVYNGQDSLVALVERLLPVLTFCASQYELILINDGSPDASWSVIDNLAAEHPWIHGINLMKNYGQHNALLCGIRAAKYEVVVTMDDDLQNPPEEIPRLLEKLADYDVVYGTPQQQQHGIWRNLASLAIKLSLRVAMKSPVAGQTSAFRAFRTELRDAFANYQSPFVFLDVLLSWGTSRFTSIQVRQDERKLGSSNYTISRLFGHAINMITGFSILPLRLASFGGFAMTLFGLGVLLYVLGRYILSGSSIPGFPFLASIIAIFSGAQMFALGIIGEYLARIHSRTMDRPPYIIRAVSGDLPVRRSSIRDTRV